MGTFVYKPQSIHRLDECPRQHGREQRSAGPSEGDQAVLTPWHPLRCSAASAAPSASRSGSSQACALLGCASTPNHARLRAVITN